MKYNWPRGRDVARIKKFCSKHGDLILGGTILAIDPASKSAGYALYKCGVFITGGSITVEGPVSKRLNKLFHKIEQLGHRPDILVIETIRATMSHIYLRWSVGALVAASNAEHVLEVNALVWRSMVPPDYVKTDSQDAYWLGKAVIELNKEVMT